MRAILKLFRKKPLLSDEDIFFQVETYKWLLKYFGGKEFYEDTQLVLPTRTYFPSKVNDVQEAATVTFETVKKYAGLEDWPCKLMAQEEDIDPVVGETLVVQNTPGSALGSFQYKAQDEVIITYNPEILTNPTQLVATFAHELGHYLTGTAPEPPPGGWENWEFATDIAATFLGFGVFMANTAFIFSQHTGVLSQGWKTSHGGYLSELEHIYALAIFVLLKDLPTEEVLSCLKSSLRKSFKAATKEIRKTNTIDQLRSVVFVEQPSSQS